MFNVLLLYCIKNMQRYTKKIINRHFLGTFSNNLYLCCDFIHYKLKNNSNEQEKHFDHLARPAYCTYLHGGKEES